MAPGDGKRSRRKALAAARDRRQVAELWLQGLTIREIATRLEIRPREVSSHLQAIRQQHLRRAGQAYERHQATMLAKFELMERVLWEQWHLSLRHNAAAVDPALRAAAEALGLEPPITGNGAWLDRLMQVWRQRVALLGLDQMRQAGAFRGVTVLAGIDEELILGTRKPGDGPEPFILDVQAVADDQPAAGEGEGDRG